MLQLQIQALEVTECGPKFGSTRRNGFGRTNLKNIVRCLAALTIFSLYNDHNYYIKFISR